MVVVYAVQVSALQQENQELLDLRRQLEGKLKAEEEKNTVLNENYEKEKQAQAGKRSEQMDKDFKAFMQQWVVSMGKENPKTAENMKQGIDVMMKEGRNEDHVWDILCCASNLHMTNVNTIEELNKTNGMLSDKNKELQEIARKYQGYDCPDSRLESVSTKRVRTNDPVYNTSQTIQQTQNNTAMNSATVDPSDCWGQFESFMRVANDRGTAL